MRRRPAAVRWARWCTCAHGSTVSRSERSTKVSPCSVRAVAAINSSGMEMARSGLAVAAGLVVFSVLFTLIGPSLGAILTTAAAGLMAAKLPGSVGASDGPSDEPELVIRFRCARTGRVILCVNAVGDALRLRLL